MGSKNENYKKDITTVERGILVNGVNCQYAMGSGVAKAYLTKWPTVRQQYMDSPNLYLGKVDYVTVKEPDLVVANCCTQVGYGYDNKKYASEEAVALCLAQCLFDGRNNNYDVYTPWVGCGLGGLSISDVCLICEKVEELMNWPLTVCEL